MIDLCLLGCGGYQPLPYRYLTSLLVRCNGSSLLIDCGEGTQIAMKQKGLSFRQIDTICFTHYHGDHIAGLPGMLLTIGNSERTEPVTLIGPKGLEHVVRSLCVIAPELPFDLKYVEITENEQTFKAGSLQLKAFKVNHRVLCYGYSVSLNRTGRFDPERAKANNIPLRYWSVLQKGGTVESGGRILTPDMVLGPARKGLKVTYTTDTRPTRSIVENAAGSDIFICEGMYGDDSMKQKAVEKKHMLFSEAANMAVQAGVGEMWLTHYSPSLVRPEEYLNNARAIFLPTYAGKDGKSRVLNFDDEE